MEKSWNNHGISISNFCGNPDLPHSDRTMPFSKHTLKSACKNETDVALHKTSKDIASIPQAFPFFALSTAFLASNIDIFASNCGSGWSAGRGKDWPAD